MRVATPRIGEGPPNSKPVFVFEDKKGGAMRICKQHPSPGALRIGILWQNRYVRGP